MIGPWIEAMRLRILPVSIAGVIAGLAAYSFFPKKPMIAVERVEPQENELIQLSLF